MAKKLISLDDAQPAGSRLPAAVRTDLNATYVRPDAVPPLVESAVSDLDLLTLDSASGTFVGDTAAPRLTMVPALSDLAAYGSGLSNGTDTSATYLTKHLAVVETGELVFAFGGFYNATGVETIAPNPYTVKVAVEVGTYRLEAKWDGQSTGTVQPGAMLFSDPLAVDVPAGTTLSIYTYVSVSAGGKWPVGLQTDSAKGEGVTVGSDLTATGTPASASVFSLRPIIALTRPLSLRQKVIGIPGDSIAFGTGDSNSKGFLYRALNEQLPTVRTAYPSDTALSWADRPDRSQYRMPLLSYCTHVVDELGTNDWKSGRAVANIRKSLLAGWRKYQRRGLRVYRTTLTPVTTSTDNWASAGNQTKHANEAARLALNAWIRGGCPIDTSGNPVDAGTAGALVAGQAGHPVTAVVEVADLVETARDSGIWRNGHTTDGTHPNATGAQAMSVAITPGLFTWATGANPPSNGGTPGGGDTTAPTAPANVTASAITQTGFTVSWDAATDDTGVTGYDVLIDGTVAASPTGTTATFTNRTPGASHSVTVRAKDAAGNTSPASSAITVTTLDVADQNGVLVLLDTSTLTAGVPATGTTVPNSAWQRADDILTGGDATNLALAVTTNGNYGTDVQVERTTKGGLHVMMQQTADWASGQHGMILDFPALVKQWLVDHPTNDYYLSVWARLTRGTRVATGTLPQYVQIASSTANYLANLYTNAGPDTDSSALGHYPNSATGATKFLGGRAPSVSEGQPWHSSVGADGWNGTAPTTTASPYQARITLGRQSPNNMSAQNRPASFIVYRVMFEDLTVSGRTWAEVDALDHAQYVREVETVGGKFYGDTWTNPDTVLPVA